MNVGQWVTASPPWTRLILHLKAQIGSAEAGQKRLDTHQAGGCELISAVQTSQELTYDTATPLGCYIPEKRTV